MNSIGLIVMITVFGLTRINEMGCEIKNDPGFPLSFDLQLLNSKGERTSTFPEGENITFRFVITNHAEVPINIAGIVFNLPCGNDNEFFRVYQRTNLKNGWVNRGKACFLPCIQIGVFNIGGDSSYAIASNGLMQVRIVKIPTPYCAKGIIKRDLPIILS